MSTHTQSMLTIADLELMPDDLNRYELVEGEILVSRSPGLTHQEILANLITIFMNYVSQHPVGKAYINPGVILDNFNSVIPDIAFVSRARAAEIASGKHITGAPDLLVEIVSPGNENARRDRVVKRTIYEKYRVQEYWIVEPLTQCIEIYRLRDGSFEQVLTCSHDMEIMSPLLPGLAIPAYRIFSTQAET